LNFDQTRFSKVKFISSQIKYVVRLFTPPIFLELLRRLFQKKYVFEGVYNHLDDVPITNDGYRNLDFIDEMYEDTKKSLANLGYNNALPEPLVGSTHHEILPFLVSALYKDGKQCKVLDFGGGMGTAYRSCATYTEVENLEIHIIETEAFFKKAKELF